MSGPTIESEETVMAATFDPSQHDAPADGSAAASAIADPFETGTADMGFQVGLWDASGIAAMTTGNIPS